MLRDVVRIHFRALPKAEQQEMLSRIGQWQMEQRDFIAATDTFYKVGDWEQLLEAIVQDQSKSFGGEHGEILVKWCVECPEELLLRRPDALLVLMLNLYSYYNIPEMMRIYGLFQQSIEQNREITVQERNNLLGEAEIMLSFLKFNDISAMSVHHRRACELLSRPSYSMGNESPWTFGCPSILMTYHRTAGKMDLETEQMRECIPYYSRVTQDHGKGADHVMEAEVFLMRGETVSAEISYHKAVEAASSKGQFSILIAAAFLAAKLAIVDGREDGVFAPLDALLLPLRENRQYTLLPTLDLCCGWLYALLGRPQEAPAWILEEDADSSVLSPALPMLQITANQILLAQGAYSQVAARWSRIHDLCGQFHYLLCDIYLQLQTSAALLRLGRREEGEALLKRAAKAALPDQIYFPFFEVDDVLITCLEEQKDIDSTKIRKLAERFRQGRSKVCGLSYEQPQKTDSQQGWGLSRREMEIAKLAAAKMTNQEIAARLFLSERTVKNHLNRVYDKLSITGAERNKRARMADVIKIST